MSDPITGCMIGTAVGDAIGLPAEGCKRATIDRRFPRPWRHRLIGRWGMCSDDTEHTFFVAQAILASHGDVDRFRRSLAWKLRWWFIAFPAGVGMATAKACIRLWLGWLSTKSGVWSAGNGPAMRSAIIGTVFADDMEARHAHVTASTELTHRDPKANYVALAVADLAAAWVRGEHNPEDNLVLLRSITEDAEWQGLLDQILHGLNHKLDCRALAELLGLERGVSGYAYHTGPMVIFAALRFGNDPREALEQLWSCGGDVDTTGAILGGILGARHGEDAFPQDWVTGIHNGPMSTTVVRRAAMALQKLCHARPISWWWIGVPIRNFIFLLIVLGHGFRRLLP